MKFVLSGKLIVEASSLDEAFARVAEHFTRLSAGEDSDIPKEGTDIRLEPVGPKLPATSTG
jgi:hypothetical protein